MYLYLEQPFWKFWPILQPCPICTSLVRHSNSAFNVRENQFLSARIASRASTSYSGLVLVVLVLVLGEVSRLDHRITSIYSFYKFRNV